MGRRPWISMKGGSCLIPPAVPEAQKKTGCFLPVHVGAKVQAEKFELVMIPKFSELFLSKSYF